MADIIKKEQQTTGTTSAAATASPQTAAAAQTTSQTGATSSLKGLSDNTTSKLNQYSAGYQQSASVQAAQDYLNGVLNKKPVADAQLSQLYDQIMNREPFTYDINGDALYQQYKDQYTNLGQQAMLDTMGNAATLTGGYGNSYATTAGNQAYQAYLQQLNAMVPELYREAYERYNQEGNDLMSRYNLAYGQYRDELGDWQSERDYANSDYWAKYNADYADYQNMFNYWNQLAQQENSAYYSERDYAYNLAMAIINKKKMPSAELLAAAGISEADAKKLGAKTSSGSSGGSSRKNSNNPSGDPAPEEEALSYADLMKYKNDQNYREEMTGSKTYSSATMESAISKAEAAGTITSKQAVVLRYLDSKRR